MLSNLSELTETVDVAISNHCLEHVPYPIEALRAIHAKIKIGGILVLAVPIDDWRTQKHFDPANIDHHLHTWTPRLLGNTLVEAGFKVERIDILSYAWPPSVQALSATLPRFLFHTVCRLFAVTARRRQMIAVATV